MPSRTLAKNLVQCGRVGASIRRHPHAHHEITRQQGRRPAPRTHPGLEPVGRRRVSQPAPDRRRVARSSHAAPDARRVPLRRQAPRADRPAAVDEPARGVARSPETGLRATWLGHSTVLVEIDGLRVLTDPVWGERARRRASPGPSASSRCRCRSSELPPLDAVLVSHDHYDHLDYPTIRELAKRRRAVRHLARRRRAPRGAGASRPSASPSSTGGSRTASRAHGRL